MYAELVNARLDLEEAGVFDIVGARFDSIEQLVGRLRDQADALTDAALLGVRAFPLNPQPTDLSLICQSILSDAIGHDDPVRAEIVSTTARLAECDRQLTTRIVRMILLVLTTKVRRMYPDTATITLHVRTAGRLVELAIVTPAITLAESDLSAASGMARLSGGRLNIESAGISECRVCLRLPSAPSSAGDV